MGVTTLTAIGSMAEGRSKRVSVKQMVNMFGEQSADGETMAAHAMPGWTTFSSGQTGIFRGLFAFKYPHPSTGVETELLLTCIGTSIYSVASDGTFSSSLVTINNSSGFPVFFAYNGSTVVAVNGSEGYNYTINAGSPAFTKIADTDFPGRPGSVCQLDTYIIVTQRNTAFFYISSLADATAYDALDFSKAMAYSDQIMRGFADHGELWLIGSDSTEIWYDSGAADFPFARIPGAPMDIGTLAPESVAATDNSLMWLTNRGQIIQARGYQYQVISTPEIEYIIQSGTSTDARAMCYTWQGHPFYQINFPTLSKSFVYDLSTKLWAYRCDESWTTDGGAYYDRNQFCVYCYGKWIVAPVVAAGKLKYLSSTNTGYDNGNTLKRIVTGHVRNQNHRIFHKEARLDVETGQPLVASTELIVNPGFETAGASADLASAWTEYNASVVARINTPSRVHSGSFSYAIALNVDSPAGIASTNPSGLFALVSGTTYTLAWWYKTYLYAWAGTATLVWYIRSLTRTGTIYEQGTWTAPTSEWTRFSTSFVSSGNRADAVLCIEGTKLTGGGSIIDIDDVSLIADPAVAQTDLSFDWSDDYGNSWKTPRTSDLGDPGEYTKRLKFSRLGSSRQRAYRATLYGPHNLSILGLHVDVEGGGN